MAVKIVREKQNSEWTKEKVVHVSNLVQVSKNLNKHPELRSITISDLEYIDSSEVRLVAKRYNVQNMCSQFIVPDSDHFDQCLFCESMNI